MLSLLHDRFLSTDNHHAWDLATGARVTLRYRTPDAAERLAPERRLECRGRPVTRRRGPSTCIDWGVTPDGRCFEAWEAARREWSTPPAATVQTLLELLDHGCDGEPRRLVMHAGDGGARMDLWRLTAREARRRGYIPLSIAMMSSVRTMLADDLVHRTLVVLDDGGEGARALAYLASLSPRPHVLVTIDCPRPRQTWTVVREAHGAYAGSPRSGTAPAVTHPDGPRLLARAAQASLVAQGGRHAQAERGLRQVQAALARRQAWEDAARVGLALGRLCLSRGRTDAADHAFGEAAAAAERASQPLLVDDAHVWRASARIAAARLTEAESLLRVMRMAHPPPAGWRRCWADAVLARCLHAQRRPDEALAALGSLRVDAPDGSVDAETMSAALGIRVEILLAHGRIFEAGREARESLRLAADAGDDAARLMAEIAHLRVLAATGDQELTQQALSAVLARASRQHAPLAALEARLVWVALLRRAGRTAEADAAHRRLQRQAHVATPLLEKAVARANRAEPREAVPDGALVVAGSHLAVPLLRLAQREEDDGAALQAIAAHVAGVVRAGRVEFQAGAAAVADTVAASGTGLTPRLGRRAIDAGVAIGPEEADSVWEMAVPVRLGERTIASLACRWPAGRRPPADIEGTLDVAAAIAAPRVDAWLASRQAVARAAITIPELVGASELMTQVRHAISRAASAPFAVLVEGESGTGKELVARAIHQLSPRRDRSFCDVNCAALPDDLVESELFGHARGAFTGALVERKGLFEEAHGGTLFLDELPDLSLRAQAKLLRVLQQHEIRRVGETFARAVDVRLVTATNRRMTDVVAEGRFRRDLLYRLDVIRIRMPALRERPDDIALLARHFWVTAAERAGTAATLSHGVIAELTRYAWPGNVRELQNVIAAMAVAAPARGIVRPGLLPDAITRAATVTAGSLEEARQQFERRFVETALARAGGSRTRAAAQLGVSRQGLLKLMARLGIHVTRRPD